MLLGEGASEGVGEQFPRGLFPKKIQGDADSVRIPRCCRAGLGCTINVMLLLVYYYEHVINYMCDTEKATALPGSGTALTAVLRFMLFSKGRVCSGQTQDQLPNVNQ